MLPSLRRGSLLLASRGYTGSFNCINGHTRGLFSTSSDQKLDDKEKDVESKATAEKVAEENSSDPYIKAAEELQNLENSAKDLHRELLLKYANAENKRRERVEEVKRRDAQYISKFGEKTLNIYESLGKVCELAQQKANASDADEKVKSLAEGLVMTHGIMKNILNKHGLMNGKQ